jgi:hypothetical protein
LSILKFTGAIAPAFEFKSAVAIAAWVHTDNVRGWVFFFLLKRELRKPITYHLGYDLKAIDHLCNSYVTLLFL